MGAPYLFGEGFVRCWLLPPPPLEKRLLDVGKRAIRVERELLDHAVEDVPDAGVLDAVVRSRVVLVHASTGREDGVERKKKV